MKLLKNKALIIVVIIIGGLIILNTFFKANQKVIVDKPLKHVSASEIYNFVLDIDSNMLKPRSRALDRALKNFSGIDIALQNFIVDYGTAYKILDTTKFESDTVILRHFDKFKNSVRRTEILTLDMLDSYNKKDIKSLNESRTLVAFHLYIQEDILNTMKRRVEYLHDTIVHKKSKN